jgi:phage shock protein PspC (stress-responsive transcriptional regulator)
MPTIHLPLRVVNGLNQREHWTKRARRAKSDRMIAGLATPAGLKPPLAITLTRIYGKRGKPMDSQDGLTAAFKGVVDGIADKIGVDDGSPLLTWAYKQKQGKAFGIIIEIKATQS